jgi:hypothetical protein
MTFNEANGRQLAAGHPGIRITKNLSSLFVDFDLPVALADN